MPAEVYEDSLDIHIDLLEAMPFEPGQVFPRLVHQGERETRRFRSIVLENEYLALKFVPALGGRLFSLFDKRCGRDLYLTSEAILDQGGIRGVELRSGALLSAGNSHRLNALGNVDSMLFPASEPGDPASVLLSEFHSGGALTHSVKYTLEPRSACIRVEVSVQNRTFRPAHYELCSFDLSAGPIQQLHPGMLIGSNCGVLCEPGTFVGEGLEEGRLYRRPKGSWLAPRQVDSYAFNLVPSFGTGTANWVGLIGMATLTEKEFLMDAAEPLLGHRMLVQNSDGMTFEATVDIYPENTYRADLQSVPGNVVAVQFKDASNHVIATIAKHVDSAPASTFLCSTELPASLEYHILPDEVLLNLTADPIHRLPVFLKLAARATLTLEFVRADTCYEQALYFNGDDPLIWWAKATNKRLGGLDGEERTELLNAHFLAPTEPCLRAEAFLSLPQTHGKEANPLLSPLCETPESFVDVGCQLIEAGFIGEAGRFLDEATRHVDFAMLHYLSAYLYLEYSNMDVQAAEHVSNGNRSQWPPCSYRDIEKLALAKLRMRFPEDKVLRERSSS